MNSDAAKSAIFDSIRRNLAESLPFDKVHGEHHAARQKSDSLIDEKSFVENVPIVRIGLKDANLAESFRENLTAVGGNCLILRNETEAVGEINRIIAALQPKKIAVSDNEFIARNLQFFETTEKILTNATAGELFSCDLGITGAQFGIAETGTLVLESEKEFNRLDRSCRRFTFAF